MPGVLPPAGALCLAVLTAFGLPGHVTAQAPAPAAPDTTVFSARVIVHMMADEAALEAARASMDEEGFFVMADDLMWYRAEAGELLAGLDVPVVPLTGRRTLHFAMGGRLVPFDFPEVTTLDVVVLYEPGKEPIALAPAELSADPTVVGAYFTSGPPGCRWRSRAEGCPVAVAVEGGAPPVERSPSGSGAALRRPWAAFQGPAVSRSKWASTSKPAGSTQ